MLTIHEMNRIRPGLHFGALTSNVSSIPLYSIQMLISALVQISNTHKVVSAGMLAKGISDNSSGNMLNIDGMSGIIAVLRSPDSPLSMRITPRMIPPTRLNTLHPEDLSEFRLSSLVFISFEL